MRDSRVKLEDILVLQTEKEAGTERKTHGYLSCQRCSTTSGIVS